MNRKSLIIIFFIFWSVIELTANPQFVNNFNRARTFYRNKRFADAAELFEKAAELAPKNSDKFKALFNAGLSYRAAGDAALRNKTELYFNAFEALKKSAEFSDDETYPKLLEKLSELLSAELVVTNVNAEDFQGLIEYYKSIIDKFTDSLYIENQLKLIENELSKLNFLRADKFTGAKQYDKAIDALQKIKEQTPDFHNINYKVAETYFAKYRIYIYSAAGFIFSVIFVWLITIKLKTGKKSGRRFDNKEEIEISSTVIDKKTLDKKIRIYSIKLKLLKLFKHFRFVENAIAKLETAHKTNIYELGKKNFNNPAVAVSFYEYLFSLGWDNPKEYFELADLYNNLKLTDSAIKTIMKIKTDLLAREQILEYYLKLAGLFQRAGNIALAVRQLENALRITPENIDIYMKIADLTTLTKNFQKAADTYVELLRMDKKLLNVIETKLELIFQQCAQSEEKFYILERFELIYVSIIPDDNKLFDIYKIMLQIRVDNNIIMTKLGRLYLKLKMFKEAYDIFKRKEQIEPDEKIYRILAVITYELKYPAEEQHYLFLLFQDDALNDKTKIERLIQLLKTSNDTDKLGIIYKKLIERKPENIEYLKNYINILIMQKKYDEMIEYSKKLVNQSAEEIEFAVERLQMIFDYYDDKIGLYKTFIELYGSVGKSALMEDYYLRLINEFSDTPLIQEKIALATIYRETGREAEAIKIYENILTFETENIDIIKHLGNLYINKNLMREAKEQFEKILKLQADNEYALLKIEYLENIVKNTHIMKFQDLLNDENTSELKKMEIAYDLSQAYFETGFYKLAIDELKKILKNSADKLLWVKSLKLITEIFIKSNQTGLGIQYIGSIMVKAVETKEDELLVKYLLAKIYLAHDDAPKAKALFEEIAVINDRFEDTQQQLFLLENIKSSRDGLITAQYGFYPVQQLKKSTLERYEIINELGRGGMGIVYKARDKKLDRVVALKQLPANTDVNSETAKRLFIEAKSVAKLNHQNIVNVFDVGDNADELYISMEYVEGKTLTEIIKAEKYVFDVNYVRNIAAQICAALEFAHQHNIIHRDIKPDNIMITLNNSVKIMDFGLAKQVNDNGGMTQEGIAMGTAQYMSPEQIRGEDIDNRTDIYAFGCVLYEMITSVPPFNSKNINALIYKHLSAAPPQLRTALPSAPEQLEQIINKCLEKDKTARYSAASEIIADLKKNY